MEKLTKDRITIYLMGLISLFLIFELFSYLYSCIGIGPCVYKEVKTKSDIIKYEDSFLFWDSLGIERLGQYKINNTEFENFKINTVYGDYIDFDVVVNYDIDSKEISKYDLHLFIGEFNLLGCKDSISYCFKKMKDIDNSSSLKDVEKNIYESFFNSYVKDKVFIKNFDLKVKINKIEILFISTFVSLQTKDGYFLKI